MSFLFAIPVKKATNVYSALSNRSRCGQLHVELPFSFHDALQCDMTQNTLYKSHNRGDRDSSNTFYSVSNKSKTFTIQ